MKPPRATALRWPSLLEIKRRGDEPGRRVPFRATEKLSQNTLVRRGLEVLIR